jgi:hypothetical protein
MRRGNRYQLPASWSWRPEPPDPDDLAARARRHADGHPESRELELLGEVECTLAPDLVGLADGNEHPVTIPPDGCEAVFLPIDVVDRISRDGVGDIADACREAQARRGTTVRLTHHDPGANVRVEVGEEGTVWLWLAADPDQRPTEATLTPAEARSLAAALNHIATEATP